MMPLDYQPRNESKPQRMGPDDWVAWIITVIVVFVVLAFVVTAMT